MPCIVVGGGAAGYFAAIACAEAQKNSQVVILERTAVPLSKVRISGGGRCNVTHSCFDPAQLIGFYPRGGKALRGNFNRFQPRDTIEWFAQRGVELKTEDDGRIFPVTDSSQTIIDCFTHSATQAGVEVRLRATVERAEPCSEGWRLMLNSGEELVAHQLLVATGSHPAVYDWLAQLGHRIVPFFLHF